MEAFAEALFFARKLMRSDDERIAWKAADGVVRFHATLWRHRDRVRARVAPPKEPRPGLDLAGKSDAELDKMLDRLMPAYLADRARRGCPVSVEWPNGRDEDRKSVV